MNGGDNNWNNHKITGVMINSQKRRMQNGVVL